MNNRVYRTGTILNFSRWNRKGYAIFASLGRAVRIGRLAIHICEMSLRKSSRKGVIVNPKGVFGRLVKLFEALEERVTRERGLMLPLRAGVEAAGWRYGMVEGKVCLGSRGVPFFVGNEKRTPPAFGHLLYKQRRSWWYSGGQSLSRREGMPVLGRED